MPTQREKEMLRTAAMTCAAWLIAAGVVAAYALAQHQDAQDDAAARVVRPQ